MGDTECSPCLQHVQNLQQNHFQHTSTFSQTHSDLLRPLSQNDTESDEDEISLFPLSNQVCKYLILCCFYFFKLICVCGSFGRKYFLLVCLINE